MKKILAGITVGLLLSACGGQTPVVPTSGELTGRSEVVTLGHGAAALFTGLTDPKSLGFVKPAGLGDGDYYLDAATGDLYRMTAGQLGLFTKMSYPMVKGFEGSKVLYGSGAGSSAAKMGDFYLNTASGQYSYYDGAKYNLLTTLALDTASSSAARVTSVSWLNVFSSAELSITGGHARPYGLDGYNVPDVEVCVLRANIYDPGITQNVLDNGGILVYGKAADGKVTSFNYTNYDYGTAVTYGSSGSFPSASGQGGFYKAEVGILHLYYFNPDLRGACTNLATTTQFPNVRYMVVQGN